MHSHTFFNGFKIEEAIDAVVFNFKG